MCGKTCEELAAFYEAIAADTRIGAYHITLYIALLRLRSKAGWVNPLTLYRAQVLHEARMSRKTFNRCMNDLSAFGYCKYEPCTDPKGRSQVYFNKL